MRRLSILIWSILLLLGVTHFATSIQAAEEYPVKPINVIMPLEGGADGDALARPICDKLSTALGKPVIIVNKPGAGGSIAYREMHDAKPDGYTIGVGLATIVTNKLQGILPYDHQDFSVISPYFINYPGIIASTKTQRPFKTIEEVLRFAKSHPGELSIATSGVGYIWWISTMAFQQETGLKFNVIPQSGASSMVAVQAAGGHTDLGITALGASKPQIEAGNLRLLAVYGPKRIPGFENVPTLKEAGYDINVGSFAFFMGPRNIPKSIIDKLAKAIEPAVNDPEYHKFAVKLNATAFFLPPDKSANYLDDQRKVFRPVMEKAGILKEK